MGNETKPCKISLEELYDHFCNRLGVWNNKMIRKYNQFGEEILSRLNEDYCKQVSVDEVSIAVLLDELKLTQLQDLIKFL